MCILLVGNLYGCETLCPFIRDYSAWENESGEEYTCTYTRGSKEPSHTNKVYYFVTSPCIKRDLKQREIR